MRTILILCEGGDDLAAVAQAVGHVDTSVTHRVHTHLMALGDDQRTRLRALVDGQWAHDRREP